MTVGPSFLSGLAVPWLVVPLPFSVGGSAIAARGAMQSCFLGQLWLDPARVDVPEFKAPQPHIMPANGQKPRDPIAEKLCRSGDTEQVRMFHNRSSPAAKSRTILEEVAVSALQVVGFATRCAVSKFAECGRLNMLNAETGGSRTSRLRVNRRFI